MRVDVRPPAGPARLTYEQRRTRTSTPHLWPAFVPPPDLPPLPARPIDLDDVLDDLIDP